MGGTSSIIVSICYWFPSQWNIWSTFLETFWKYLWTTMQWRLQGVWVPQFSQWLSLSPSLVLCQSIKSVKIPFSTLWKFFRMPCWMNFIFVIFLKSNSFDAVSTDVHYCHHIKIDVESKIQYQKKFFLTILGPIFRTL